VTLSGGIIVRTSSSISDELKQSLDEATERAERAEAELARVKSDSSSESATHVKTEQPNTGEAELRNDSMMAHLLDSLRDGKDIGHYGRLVFAMVARSEEHTSELQSLAYLVCRLLLEKK